MSDTYAYLYVNFFEQKVQLNLYIVTSAKDSEEANDAGEGKGGRWTNFFFANGKAPLHWDKDKVIQGVGAPGEANPTQTTCGLRLIVK